MDIFAQIESSLIKSLFDFSNFIYKINYVPPFPLKAVSSIVLEISVCIMLVVFLHYNPMNSWSIMSPYF